MRNKYNYLLNKNEKLFIILKNKSKLNLIKIIFEFLLFDFFIFFVNVLIYFHLNEINDLKGKNNNIKKEINNIKEILN